MPNHPQNPQKRNEMEQNETEIKKSPLSRRQETALPHIIAAPTLAQAARSAGISQATLRRWLTDDAFRQELTRQRQQTAALARQELQGLMLRSIAVIAEALNAPDITTRRRAARCALSLASKSPKPKTSATNSKKSGNS